VSISPLTGILPYPLPRKITRCRWKLIARLNVDNGPCRAAEDVQLLVVSRCRGAVAGLVLIFIEHCLL
jgi:hypothetical protein